MKQRLRQWFTATLDAIAIADAMRDAAEQIQTSTGPGAPVLVIAFGKAARPMAHAMAGLLPDRPLRGLVVPTEADAAPLPPFEVIAGGHPLPTAGSLRAATRALALCASATADEHVVFLVSGGGSAMLELPCEPQLPLDELRRFYAALVGCGADIDAINTVRRHVSAVKGGRLALAAAGAGSLHTFAISDVPDDAAHALASGPTVPDPTTIGDCEALIRACDLGDRFPAALRRRLQDRDLPVALTPDHPLAARSEFRVLLDNEAARDAMRQRVAADGIHVVVDQSVDDMPFGAAADRLLERLDVLHRQHADRPVAVLTGGELSVPLPPRPGRGGRNQQLALHCALRIAGAPITAFSCGTDGIDGNSPAAGAIADGSTLTRASALGFDAGAHLRQCDAYPLFSELEDTIETGPTGHNVRDLRLLIRSV